MNKWRVATIFWLAVFSIGTIFLLIRKTDGTGAIQTPKARLAALAVLGIAFLIILIIQLIWYKFLKRK